MVFPQATRCCWNEDILNHISCKKILNIWLILRIAIVNIFHRDTTIFPWLRFTMYDTHWVFQTWTLLLPVICCQHFMAGFTDTSWNLGCFLMCSCWYDTVSVCIDNTFNDCSSTLCWFMQFINFTKRVRFIGFITFVCTRRYFGCITSCSFTLFRCWNTQLHEAVVSWWRRQQARCLIMTRLFTFTQYRSSG